MMLVLKIKYWFLIFFKMFDIFGVLLKLKELILLGYLFMGYFSLIIFLFSFLMVVVLNSLVSLLSFLLICGISFLVVVFKLIVFDGFFSMFC